jgi:D-isomer specific 2-hydroxyacid dehydrogenase, NAD binding domain
MHISYAYRKAAAGALSRERGVWLTSVPDLLTAPTAELTLGLAIALTRKLRAAHEWVRSGEFRGWRPEFYGLGIAGSTVAIIGMGAIGRALARRLSGWNARLVYTDRARFADDQHYELEFLPLEAALSQADLVLLALPLTADTLHTIDDERLGRLRPGAYLVNSCRGSVVETLDVGAQRMGFDIEGAAPQYPSIARVALRHASDRRLERLEQSRSRTGCAGSESRSREAAGRRGPRSVLDERLLDCGCQARRGIPLVPNADAVS